MPRFYIDFHHGGYFDENTHYQGDVSEWECDSEYWGFYEVKKLAREMKYTNVDQMWYKAGEEWRQLTDDNGAAELVELAIANGKVHIYLIHAICQPEVINAIGYGPTDEDQNDGDQNDGAQPTESEHNEFPLCNWGTKMQLVNNMSETFNSVIVGPRGKPVVTMFEEIRVYLMERWVKNRERFDNLEAGAVLPNIQKKIVKAIELSRYWMCRPAGLMIYEVYRINNQSVEKYTVNLQNMDCSCRLWRLTGIPCCYAITCYKYRNEDPANCIPSFYRKEAYVACYQPMIYPTNGENLWEATPYPDILPPPVRRMPGRPKRSRNKAADEKQKDPSLVSKRRIQNKCSICKQPGHKSRSCKVVPPTQPQSSTQAPTTEPQSAPTQPPTPTQPQSAPTQAPTTQPQSSTTQAPAPTQESAPTQAPTTQASKKRKNPAQTKKSKTAQTTSSQPIPDENVQRLKRLRKVGTSTQPTASATSSLFNEGATSTRCTRSKLQTRKATS